MHEDVAWIREKCKVIRMSSRLVLIGTAALAVIGGTLVFVTNQRTYESRMVIPLSPRVLGLLKTEAVLGPVLEGMVGRPVSENDRRSLANRIAISSEMSRGSSLYAVSVEAQKPDEAQIVLEKILKEILRVSKPSGSSREKIQEEIKSLNGTIADLNKLSKRLNDNAEHVSGGASGEMYARAFVFLISESRAQEHRLLELKDALEGLRADDVVIRPTLPAAPRPGGLARKLTVVGGASFLFMCLFVLFRDEWRKRLAAVL